MNVNLKAVFFTTKVQLSIFAIATPINHDLFNNPEWLKKVTNNIPLGLMGEAEDAPGIIAFLALDEAKYITGSTFYI